MTQYIAKRLGQTLLIVFLVSFLTFLLVAVMPKDPVYILYGTDLTPEEYEIAYKALGLDQPLLTRYVDWLAGVFHGDFGISYKYHLPVTEIIGQKIGVTLYLSLVSTCISFPLGILFGVITAVKRGKWPAVLTSCCIRRITCRWILMQRTRRTADSGHLPARSKRNCLMHCGPLAERPVSTMGHRISTAVAARSAA